MPTWAWTSSHSPRARSRPLGQGASPTSLFVENSDTYWVATETLSHCSNHPVERARVALRQSSQPQDEGGGVVDPVEMHPAAVNVPPLPCAQSIAKCDMPASTPRPHTARVVSGLTTSDRRERLRFGHDSTQGAVFVQVAEHLDADGLVQAAHLDRFVAADADQVSDQVACGVVVRSVELHCTLGLPPRGRGQ